MARQLTERPCKTLEFETRQSGLMPVLRRPVEVALESNGMDSSSPHRHLSARLVSDTTNKRKSGHYRPLKKGRIMLTVQQLIDFVLDSNNYNE